MFSSSHLHISSSLHMWSSHLHIFTSTNIIFSSSHLHISCYHHLLIFASTHIIFSSSHAPNLTPSHLHICTYIIFSPSHLLIFTFAHLHICTLLLRFLSPTSPRLLYIFLALGRGRWKRGSTKCNAFARNKIQSTKIAVKLRVWGVRGNPFARNDVFDRQKLRVNYDLTSSTANLPLEMRFYRQKLR